MHLNRDRAGTFLEDIISSVVALFVMLSIITSAALVFELALSFVLQRDFNPAPLLFLCFLCLGLLNIYREDREILWSVLLAPFCGFVFAWLLNLVLPLDGYFDGRDAVALLWQTTAFICAASLFFGGYKFILNKAKSLFIHPAG